MNSVVRGPTDDLSAFIRRLRTERERRGLTQGDIARSVGLRGSAISEYERDVTARARPSDEVMRHWLHVLERDDLYMVWKELSAAEDVVLMLRNLGIEASDVHGAVVRLVRSAIRDSHSGR